MPRRLLLVLTLTLFVLAPTPVSAEEDAAPASDEAARPSLLSWLGQPARSEVVASLLVDLRHARVDPSELAVALGHAGGVAACEGLARVVRHRGSDVRIVALAAVERVALRHDRLAREVRRLAKERSGEERIRALEALGRVGDGRDVPLLLDAASSEDREVKRAACRGLKALTGAEIPPIPARWRWYCHTFQGRTDAFLPAALDAIETDPDDVAAEHHLGLVLRYGWADLPLVDEALWSWFYSPDRRLRKIACRVAAELRLARYAPTVQRTLDFASRSSPEREAAFQALRVLGVPEGAATHARVRDRDKTAGVKAASR